MAIFVLEQHKNDEYENQISQTFLSHLPDAADWQLEHDGKMSPRRAGHDQATSDEHLRAARQHQF